MHLCSTLQTTSGTKTSRWQSHNSKNAKLLLKTKEDKTTRAPDRGKHINHQKNTFQMT